MSYHSTLPRVLAFSHLQRGVLLGIILLFFMPWRAVSQAYDLVGIQNDSVPDLELVRRGETLKAYHLHPILSSPIQTAPDTTFINYYCRCYVEGYGLAIGNNGNFVGPRHYKTFFDRLPEWDPFVYGQAFDQLFYRRERLLYYDTRSPFTKLSYHRFGPVEQREETLDMTLALNVNKSINLGGDFNYFLSRGAYINNIGRQVGYRLFGSYQGTRYEAYFSGGNNYIKLQENGGLANDDYINNPEKFSGSRQSISSIEIPVKYTQGVGNTLFIGHVNLNHRFHLGSKRRFLLGDRLPDGKRTPEDTTLFVPIASIGHQFELRKGTRLFIGNNKTLEKEYPHTFPYFWKGKTIKENNGKGNKVIDDAIQVVPFDSVRITELNNTVSFQMREGFRPWVKLGITAFARFENRFFFMRDSIEGSGRSNEFNTYVGGNVKRSSGKGLNFDVTGEVAVVGHDVGNFRIFGNVVSQFSLWGIPFGIEAEGRFTNLRPPTLLEHHRGTYVRWDTDLPFTQSLLLSSSISLPRFGTTLSVHSATLNNYVYFDRDLFPKVFDKPLQVLEARILHRYFWRLLHWDLAASYQLSSQQEVLPLPTLSAFGSVYLRFKIAKVMDTQFGVDCSFHTAYHAPYYDVATQQFVNQQEISIGNFPLLNAFASFKLRRVRFFLCYYNLGDYFISSVGRWSLPHMPINPPSLRLGISFDFNN